MNSLDWTPHILRMVGNVWTGKRMCSSIASNELLVT